MSGLARRAGTTGGRLVLLFAGFVLALTLHAGCGGENSATQPGLRKQAPAEAGLPGLAELEQLPDAPLRDVSQTEFNLVRSFPLDSSMPGTVDFPDMPQLLSLDPAAAGGLAWAIYGLGGFPLDGSVVPLLLSGDPDAPVWIAVADYSSSRWDFSIGEQNGDFTELIVSGQRCISPAGRVYVAVIAQDAAANLEGLILDTSPHLPGDPEAVLNLSSTSILPGASLEADAIGSSAGSGEFYSFEYDFGDAGEADHQFLPSADSEASWVYQQPGDYEVSLTVHTREGRSASASATVSVEPPPPANRELLLVYNSSMPDDVALAEYYADSLTGRNIDAACMLGLPLAPLESFSDTITREEFDATIHAPIKAILDDPENSDIVADIRYILLMKGIPHRISGIEDFVPNDGWQSTVSSVDSELCTLHSYGSYAVVDALYNGPSMEAGEFYGFGPNHSARQFYLAGDEEFSRGSYDVTDGTTVWPLDYLVGRITAYTYDEARAIIDRAKTADSSGTGWVVFDSSDGAVGGGYTQNQFDSMVDPVWPYAGDVNSGAELLVAAGFSVFADVSQAVITNESNLLPQDFSGELIAYAGWGRNHVGDSFESGDEYIIEDLGWSYRPGACFMTYESFNGTDFDEANGIYRREQGQLADFLRMGGTVGIGNAWEPFAIGAGDERWIFDRYLDEGDVWIEAAYKGLRLLSWQEVVVGDPLCRVADN